MKRDMELIRKIMLAIQAKEDLRPEQIFIEGAGEAVVGRHLEMLLGEGLVEGSASQKLGMAYPRVFVSDLSWAGHDFIGSISKDEWWAKIKEAVGPAEIATLSLKSVRDAAIAWSTAYVKSKLGV